MVKTLLPWHQQTKTTPRLPSASTPYLPGMAGLHGCVHGAPAAGYSTTLGILGVGITGDFTTHGAGIIGAMAVGTTGVGDTPDGTTGAGITGVVQQFFGAPTITGTAIIATLKLCAEETTSIALDTEHKTATATCTPETTLREPTTIFLEVPLTTGLIPH